MSKSLHRLLFVLALASIMLVPVSVVRADDAPQVHITDATDFAADARLAARRRLPLMVVFTADGCSYCELLEDDFVKPMLISGDYTNKVIIRRVNIDGFAPLRDFNGKTISVDDFTARYHVSVTPTVVFLDPHGKPLAQRLVGVSTPDFYGGYLDQAIDTALAHLHAEHRVSAL